MGILSFLFGCNDKPTGVSRREEGDAKFASVMALPNGLEVTHVPDKVYAEKGGISRRAYTWRHKTSVRSTAGDLTVVEFGAFVLVNGRWTFGTVTGKPFTPNDFANWYSCPDAQLKNGQAYTDPQNWTAGDSLYATSNRWYYIAKNLKGEQFKGIAQIDTIAQVKNEGESAPWVPQNPPDTN
jgi:hypothetical protein